MTQTKRQSAVETMANVGSGYFIAMALNLFFLPHYTKEIAEQSIIIAIYIGLVYTIVSVIRSFGFRRLFNKLHGEREYI